jgi:sacsin
MQAQLPVALLFLKSVRKVSVWVKSAPVPAASGAEGDAPAAPRLLFEASAEVPASGSSSQRASQSLQAPITRFISEASSGGAPGGTKGPASSASSAGAVPGLLKRLGQLRPDALPCDVGPLELTFRSGVPEDGLDGSPDAAGTIRRESWMVCNALGAGQALGIAARESAAGGAKMIPWVGVAARLQVEAPGSAPAGGPAPGSAPEPASPGAAFCFLPLPVATGLPLHVNAFFELSSNRRDIW